MKQHEFNPLWRTTLLAAFLALLAAGCASSRGYNQADKTGEAITTVRNDLVNIKSAIDASAKALDGVIAAASTDPRKPYEAFATSVDKVDAAANTAKKDAETMRACGAAYFQQWEAQTKSVKSDDIRKLSEERKAKLQASFDEIKSAAQEAKQSFPGFLSDLKDLRTALGSDLSPQGIAAAKDVIQKTKTSGAEAQKDLDNLITEMNTVVAAITAAKQAPKKPTTAPSSQSS
jgi:hypothetical protein